MVAERVTRQEPHAGVLRFFLDQAWNDVEGVRARYELVELADKTGRAQVAAALLAASPLRSGCGRAGLAELYGGNRLF